MRVAVCFVFCALLFCVRSQCIDSNGVERLDGESYLGRDRCNMCRCGATGGEVCTRMLCVPGNLRCMGPGDQVYDEGDHFQSDDGCNQCTCTTLGVICTERACMTVGVPPA